jgi:hypothetical protein
MAKIAKRRIRREWTTQDVLELKAFSKARRQWPLFPRRQDAPQGALRQKARILGVPLGQRR